MFQGNYIMFFAEIGGEWSRASENTRCASLVVEFSIPNQEKEYETDGCQKLSFFLFVPTRAMKHTQSITKERQILLTHPPTHSSLLMADAPFAT
jgi:hypothetical protein